MTTTTTLDVHLAHVGFTVSNLERSLQFWQEGLGLELVLLQEKQGGYLEQITAEPGAHALQAHLQFPGSNLRIELLQYLKPPGTRIVARPPDVGTGHVAILCTDLDATLARLAQHGGRPFGSPVLIDTGLNKGSRAVYVRDPDDHIAELVQRPA
ncbi:MAG TPA: VOC family protein [Acidimicrobiales bacterium]|nr:VOC family protein [Acidimicrobiales bacterium]